MYTKVYLGTNRNIVSIVPGFSSIMFKTEA